MCVSTAQLNIIIVRADILTAVTTKNAVFWDVVPFRRNVGSHKIYTAPHPRRRFFNIIIVAHC
jgi:hypothetical protein